MNGKLFRTGGPGGRSLAKRALVLTLTVAVVVLVSASAGTASRTATPPPPTKKQLQTRRPSSSPARKVGTLNFYTSADQVTAQKLAGRLRQEVRDQGHVHPAHLGPDRGALHGRGTVRQHGGGRRDDRGRAVLRQRARPKWMMPMNATTVPNVATIAKKFRFFGSVGIGISRLDGVVINTNARQGQSTCRRRWKDLTIPRFKGRLLAGDPRTVPVNMGQWKVLRATYGDDYLKAMGGQGIQWVASLVSGVQTVAADERDRPLGANFLHMNPLLASAPTPRCSCST